MNETLAIQTFSEDLAYEFAQAGVCDAFVVTGGAIAPFTSAIASQGRIRMHFMLTEQSAGIAAESYGYVDGLPALLIVTSGPGVTNALTPIAAAWTNSSPLIVVSGQSRSGDVEFSNKSELRQVGNQHLRTDLIVSSFVKKFLEPNKATDAHEIVSNLLNESTRGRPGPVWLSIPQDIQRSPKSDEKINFIKSKVAFDFESSKFKTKVSQLLSESKSPSILIGNGGRKAISRIIEFADFFNIPIMTTWPGLDLIEEDNPLYCGRPGSIPSTWAPNLITVNTDFLMIFGARLDLAQVGYNPSRFAPNASVVRVDIDDEEFHRIPQRNNWFNFQVEIVDIIGPLGEIIDSNQPNGTTQWWKQIASWKKNYPKPLEISQNLIDGASSYYLISEISKSFPNKFIVTGNSGTCMEMLLQSWNTIKGQRVINSCGLGSMGFAISSAIGIALKFNCEEVICIESDGSFAMNVQDLQTMMEIGTRFKIIIMDSSGYKSISLSQKRLGQIPHGSSKTTGLSLPDPVSIASAFGLKSLEISESSEIPKALDWLVLQETTSLLVVKVSENEDALPRLISKPNKYGVMETPDMNILHPVHENQN
jgi:acetolactate synthase-1/2/3 large subunit